MKTKMIFAFFLLSSYCFSQSINDYKAVIVPLKFDFLKTDNQYRLATLTKFNLQNAGFTALYANQELPVEFIGERCDLLNADVIKESGFLVTKLYVVFKDCYGKIVFTSTIGKSKIKEFEPAYKEALEDAFVSIYKLHYKYNGAVNAINPNSIRTNAPTAAPASTNIDRIVMTCAPVSSVNLNAAAQTILYAQPTETGYQLIDTTPKVVMKLLKTTQSDSFIAIKNGIQGSLINKNGQWFFEYYQENKLISELIKVKF